MKLLDYTITLPTRNQTVTLIPFGCVHADDPGHSVGLWEECIERIASTPLCVTVGVGDYRSLARTTYRKHIRGYRADEDSQRDIDNLVKASTHEFYEKYLKRIKHKLIGLAEGNHNWEFLDGTTDTQLLCRLAGVPYLEKGSGIRLNFLAGNKPGHGGAFRVLKMLVHHGDWGSAGTPGGDLNSALTRTDRWDVDIVVVSHTHRKLAFVDPVLTFPASGELRIVDRPRALLRTGCFVKGYVEGCITYAERKMMRPTAVGYTKLEIEFTASSGDDRYRFIPTTY